MFIFYKNLLIKSTNQKFNLIKRCINAINKDVIFSNGRILSLSSGKLSKLADGSSVARIGETNVMVTTVSVDKLNNSYFVPLTVDYREKASAGGRIPTNHLRRDLQPTEREILSSRIIDRSLRNSFPAGYFYDTQVVCNVLSIDSINDPDVIAANAASTALSVSNIPWYGPVGTVRISKLDDKLITNPTKKEMISSSFNLIITSNKVGKVLMLEGSGKEVTSNSTIIEMINLAIKENNLIIDKIEELKSNLNVVKRKIDKLPIPTEEQINDAYLISSLRLKEIFSNHGLDKKQRNVVLESLKEDIMSKLKEKYPQEDPAVLLYAYWYCGKMVHTENVFETNTRCDGRKVDEIRPLYSESSLYKPLHGSALFQRGQTQVLASLTFDSPDTALRINNYGFPDEIKEKNFMLHYEFPKYATNEIGRIGSFGRREIGHGSLAEKALKPIVPDNLPFVTRLYAEVLESSGSSSMASVCAGSLAMMDAGIDLNEHCAGIAMGLLKHPKEKEKFKVLTDILGFEDFNGEMDFKIAGTKSGITALQLDCKLEEGLNISIIEESLVRAESAIAFIIEHMNKTISKPNLNKTNLPIIKKIEIPPFKRGTFLGLNGFNLKKLKAEIGVTITQDNDSNNNFLLFAPNKDALEEAEEFIKEKLEEEQEVTLEFGAIYDAKIVEIKEGGVMIKIKGQPTIYLKNKHLDKRLVRHASSLGLQIGSEIQVKYFGRDPVNGELRLSRKVLQV